MTTTDHHHKEATMATTAEYAAYLDALRAVVHSDEAAHAACLAAYDTHHRARAAYHAATTDLDATRADYKAAIQTAIDARNARKARYDAHWAALASGQHMTTGE